MLTRLFSCALALALVTGLAATAQAQDAAGIATSRAGSLYHSSGTAIARIANENGLRATVQPFASPNVYIPAVHTGRIAFGLANVYEFTLALNGQMHFEGRQHPDLRAIGIMYPLRIAFFVRKDSDIRTIADLRGKSMPGGYTSQRILLPLIDAELATAGLTRDDYTEVPVASVVAGGDAFIAGRVDGFLFALGAAKVREANAAVGIRALPVENTPENLAALREHLPVAYLREQRPHPSVPSVSEPMHVIAYDALVFASTHTSEDAAYQLAKAMHGNKQSLAEAFGPFNLFSPENMAKQIEGVEYHPGAVRFYREQGIWPAE